MLPREKERKLLEVPVQQALEALAVPGFIAADLMNDIMYGIKIELLRLLRQIRPSGNSTSYLPKYRFSSPAKALP